MIQIQIWIISASWRVAFIPLILDSTDILKGYYMLVEWDGCDHCVPGTDGGVCKWADRNHFSNDTDYTHIHLLCGHEGEGLQFSKDVE